MGTRGLFGFYHRGKFYVVYNHFDSYQSGLGAAIAREVAEAGPDGIVRWKKALDRGRIIVVSVSDGDAPKPTAEDIQRLAPYTNTDVGVQTLADWYVLTHKCQGSLVRVMESGYLLNHVDPRGKPMWEEHAYIVDLDRGEFKHYVGRTLARARRLADVTAAMFEGDLDV